MHFLILKNNLRQNFFNFFLVTQCESINHIKIVFVQQIIFNYISRFISDSIYLRFD